MIRKGETNSFVEICLYEPENKNSIDGNIIISREINLNGRNMCKINGRMVTVNELKDFMKTIIEIHGQNDSQNLLDSKEHIKYLDCFAGIEIKELKEEYKKYYVRFNEIKKDLKENLGDDKERQRKLDLLKYQINEIEAANLIEGEEEELENKQKIITNSEKIATTLNDVDVTITENTIDLISNSIRNLEKIQTIDTKYQEITNSLKSVYYEIQEISRDLSNYKDEIYFDEEEQKKIEERLDLIFSLKRKYGNSIKEIIEYKQEIEDEVYRIENLDEYVNQLKKEQIEVKQKLDTIGIKIHNIREIKSKELSKKINKNLQDLEMKNAKVNIHIDYIENEYFDTGKNKVEFFINTNLGEDEKQLIKIASGGEMSRVMLGIKTVIADTDKISVLIFDEIDKAKNLIARINDRNIFPHARIRYMLRSADDQAEKFVLAVRVIPADSVVRYREGDFHETVYIKGDGNTVPATPEEIISLSKRKFGVDNETTDIQYNEKDWADYLSLCKEYREDSSVPTVKELQNEEIITADGFVKSGFIMFCDGYDGDDTLVCCRLWRGEKKPGLYSTAKDIKDL